MLSAGASAATGEEGGGSCSRPNESGNFALGCHRDSGCKITAHYTKVTAAPGPVIIAAWNQTGRERCHAAPLEAPSKRIVLWW